MKTWLWPMAIQYYIRPTRCIYMLDAVGGNNDSNGDRSTDRVNTHVPNHSDDRTTIMTAISFWKWSMCFYVNASTDFKIQIRSS